MWKLLFFCMIIGGIFFCSPVSAVLDWECYDPGFVRCGSTEICGSTEGWCWNFLNQQDISCMGVSWCCLDQGYIYIPGTDVCCPPNRPLYSEDRGCYDPDFVVCCQGVSDNEYYLRNTCNPDGDVYYRVVDDSFCSSIPDSVSVGGDVESLSFFDKVSSWFGSFFSRISGCFRGDASVGSVGYGGVR